MPQVKFVLSRWAPALFWSTVGGEEPPETCGGCSYTRPQLHQLQLRLLRLLLLLLLLLLHRTLLLQSYFAPRRGRSPRCACCSGTKTRHRWEGGATAGPGPGIVSHSHHGRISHVAALCVGVGVGTGAGEAADGAARGTGTNSGNSAGAGGAGAGAGVAGFSPRLVVFGGSTAHGRELVPSSVVGYDGSRWCGVPLVCGCHWCGCIGGVCVCWGGAGGRGVS